MKHVTIMLIDLRNNSLQLSFIAVRRVSCVPSACWAALCDSHSFSFCPSKPSQSFSYPLTLCPTSLPPILLLNVYTESVIQPQPFRSFFFCSPLSLSLSIFPLTRFFSVRPLLRRQWCRQTGRKISAGAPQDWREGWQRESRGEEDT